MGEFKRSRFFTPRPLKLRESAYERRETKFMVLAVEPHSVPSSKGILHWKVQEASVRAGLKTHTSVNLAISGAPLIFQEKVILEQRKIRRNTKKCLTKMDTDCDLENGIRVEMD
jgi:hypothetical protein